MEAYALNAIILERFVVFRVFNIQLRIGRLALFAFWRTNVWRGLSHNRLKRESCMLLGVDSSVRAASVTGDALSCSWQEES